MLAFVLAVAVVGGCGSSVHTGSSTALAHVSGYRWRVVEIHDRAGTLRTPATSTARVSFTRDGYVLGDDTVNALQGRVHPTTRGYTVSDSAATLVGYAGDDKTVLRTVAAVDAMFFIVAKSADAPAPDVQVQVTANGDTVTLHAGDTELVLARSGAEPDFTSGLSPT